MMSVLFGRAGRPGADVKRFRDSRSSPQPLSTMLPSPCRHFHLTFLYRSISVRTSFDGPTLLA